MSSSRVRPLFVLLAVVLSCLAVAPPASATVAPEPVVGPVGWTPDGPVHAVVSSGDRVYVGGAFTGGVAALDATTGAPIWTGTANGDVRALAMSADGTHVLAGGAFTSVSGVTHRKLASLDAADGTAEPKWKASAGGTVRDIVVLGDTAYFAGAFTNHAGMTQKGLGAVSVSTGKNVTDFTTTTDGIVYSLATDGVRLYLGGKFTAVDSQPRNQVASVTLGTRTLDLWTPPRMCTGCNVVWDMTTANGLVYIVGRNGGAAVALDALTGLPRWRQTRVNGDAQAVTLFDGKLWVGGHFTTISGLPRMILAAFDPLTGALDPFSARFVTSYPGIWALGSSSNRLYVGGAFTATGPKPNRFPYFAMFGAG